MKSWPLLTLGIGAAALAILSQKESKEAEISWPSEEKPEDLLPPPEPKQSAESIERFPGGLRHYKPVLREKPEFGVPELTQLIQSEKEELTQRFDGLQHARDFKRYCAELMGSTPTRRLPKVDADAAKRIAYALTPKSLENPKKSIIEEAVGSFLSLFAFNPTGGREREVPTKELSIGIDERLLDGARPVFWPQSYFLAISSRQEDPVITQLVWHELSHVLEHKAPAISLATNAFLRMRTQKDKQTTMKKLQPKMGYGSNEIVRPDRFQYAYIGRIYKTQMVYAPGMKTGFPVAPTEILSMGLESFAASDASMQLLWERDPDHFCLVSAIVRGRVGHV